MKYEIPKMETVEFVAEDVITASRLTNAGTDGVETTYKWTDLF